MPRIATGLPARQLANTCSQHLQPAPTAHTCTHPAMFCVPTWSPPCPAPLHPHPPLQSPTFGFIDDVEFFFPTDKPNIVEYR